MVNPKRIDVFHHDDRQAAPVRRSPTIVTVAPTSMRGWLVSERQLERDRLARCQPAFVPWR